MEDKFFDAPVHVKLASGKERIVVSTSDAAACLLYKWPEKRGNKHLAARKACMAVLEGLKEARAARKAFEAAAKESECLVDMSRFKPS